MAHLFEGKSDNGDFTEALRNAIILAKEKLHTDHILWKLESTTGEDGGFILINSLTISISVMVPTS